MHFDNLGRERPPTFTEIQTAWELLSAAIVRAAIEDYKCGGTKRRQEVERFIMSEYFTTISDIDPRWLLKNLRETFRRKTIGG